MNKNTENVLIAIGLAVVMLVIYTMVTKDKTPKVPEPETLKTELSNVRKSWKEIVDIPLDIRYATQYNFTNQKIYNCARCFLKEEVAVALQQVQQKLEPQNFTLVLFDCYRPKSAQQKLWDIVPNPNYVTPPEKGSMHNKGLAVDLSIADASGTLVDMGTDYDHFGIKAHVDHYDLPNRVLKNRKILNDAMTEFGFKGIRTEWWHYSYTSLSASVESWEWDCN